MQTLIEIPTKADDMTLPGGIALRFHTHTTHNEYIVHNYNTDRESGTSRAYWQGSYCGDDLAKAMKELARRVERAAGYDTGGAIDHDKLAGVVRETVFTVVE